MLARDLATCQTAGLNDKLLTILYTCFYSNRDIKLCLYMLNNQERSFSMKTKKLGYTTQTYTLYI